MNFLCVCVSAVVVCDFCALRVLFVRHFCVFPMPFWWRTCCVYFPHLCCVFFVWIAYGLRFTVCVSHYLFNELGACCSTFVLRVLCVQFAHGVCIILV